MCQHFMPISVLIEIFRHPFTHTDTHRYTDKHKRTHSHTHTNAHTHSCTQTHKTLICAYTEKCFMQFLEYIKLFLVEYWILNSFILQSFKTPFCIACI